MDLRYQSIVSSQISIEIVYAGIFIADVSTRNLSLDNFNESSLLVFLCNCQNNSQIVELVVLVL